MAFAPTRYWWFPVPAIFSRLSLTGVYMHFVWKLPIILFTAFLCGRRHCCGVCDD